MVLSVSKLVKYLDQKAYIEATNYANQQLAEDAISDDHAALKSAQKCINTLAHYLYNLTPSPEKEKHNGIVSLLVDTFVQSLNCLTSTLKATELVTADFANKILLSTYHVSTHISKIKALRRH